MFRSCPPLNVFVAHKPNIMCALGGHEESASCSRCGWKRSDYYHELICENEVYKCYRNNGKDIYGIFYYDFENYSYAWEVESYLRSIKTSSCDVHPEMLDIYIKEMESGVVPERVGVSRLMVGEPKFNNINFCVTVVLSLWVLFLLWRICNV